MIGIKVILFPEGLYVSEMHGMNSYSGAVADPFYVYRTINRDRLVYVS